MKYSAWYLSLIYPFAYLMSDSTTISVCIYCTSATKYGWTVNSSTLKHCNGQSTHKLSILRINEIHRQWKCTNTSDGKAK